MYRFIALACLAFAAVLASIYFLDLNSRARALAGADQTLAARAHLIADTVDRTLQWRMTEVFTFAALPSLRGFAASDDAARPARAAVALVELKAIVAADPNVRAASIVDPSGEVILTTDASMRANWTEHMFVREPLAGHLYASVPARDFGEVSQYYSASIIDNVGNVVSVLVVRVAALELYSAAIPQSNGLLVDENGVRIADWTAAPKNLVALAPIAPAVAANLLAEKRYGAEVTQIPATNLAALAAETQRGNAATLTFRDASDQPIRAAIRRLVTYPWTVVVMQNEDAIFSDERDALWGMLAFGAVAMIAGAVLWGALRGIGDKD